MELLEVNYANATDSFLDELGDYVDGIFSHAKVANLYRKSSSYGYINYNLQRNLNGGLAGRYGYGESGAIDALTAKGISTIKIGEAYSTNGFSTTSKYAYGNSANARNTNSSSNDSKYLYNYINPLTSTVDNEDGEHPRVGAQKLLGYTDSSKGYAVNLNVEDDDALNGTYAEIEWGGDIVDFLKGEVADLKLPERNGLGQSSSKSSTTLENSQYDDGPEEYTTWNGKGAASIGRSEVYDVNYSKDYTHTDIRKWDPSLKENSRRLGISLEQKNKYLYSRQYVGHGIGYRSIAFDKDGNVINTPIETGFDTNDFAEVRNTRTDIGLYNENEDGTASLLGGRQSDIGQFTPIRSEVSTFLKEKGLVYKTNELFKQGKINSMISRFTSNNDDEYARGRNLKSGVSKDNAPKYGGYKDIYCRVWTANKEYSHVSDLIRPFSDQTSYETQMRKTHLRRPDGKGQTLLDEHSVLMQNGFVKIAPTNNAKRTPKEDIKRCMFSIENLAWKDVSPSSRVLDGTGLKSKPALSPEQQGDHGGRVMWFPPYNIKFSENVNVDWNENKFIGRGESLYTYTNTRRTGTLDFTLLIDHPSIVDAWAADKYNAADKDTEDENLLRFFAGCGMLDLNDNAVASTVGSVEKVVTGEEPVYGNVEVTTSALVTTTETVQVPKDASEESPQYVDTTKQYAFVIFFPNNYSGQNPKYGEAGQSKYKNISEIWNDMKDYENGASTIETHVCDKDYTNQSEGTRDNLNSTFKLNNFTSADTELKKKIQSILTELNGIPLENIRSFHEFHDLATSGDYGRLIDDNNAEVTITSIHTYGHASSHGYLEYNNKLATRRAYVAQLFSKELNGKWENIEKCQTSIIDVQGDSINEMDAKYGRCSVAILDLNLKEESTPTVDAANGSDGSSVQTVVQEKQEVQWMTTVERQQIGTIQTTTDVYSGFNDKYNNDNEYLYFRELEDTSPIIYKHLVDKVQYFDPAYHSITPEGFNERLTFLHQCTRQGGTKSVTETYGTEDEMGSDAVAHAANLSFGRPPFCILKIGDFFNTKICIDSMSINYDNSGVQWDLNPEGAGVQPMFANISLSFTFLGGQDITGPVEELQNAISSRYYANASIYDSRVNMK